jgi:hypothetical protein
MKDEILKKLNEKLEALQKETPEKERDRQITELEKGLKSVEAKIDTGLSALSEELKKKLESELVLEINKEELRGQDGKNYVLTKKDKKEIAKLIEVPIVKKVIERTEVIKEKPIVTNEVKEIAVYESPQAIRDKIETLKDDERLDLSAVKGINLLEKNILDRAISILDQRTSYLIQKVSALNERPSGTGVLSPTTFDFTDLTNQNLSTVLTSNSITLAGDSNTVWPFVMEGASTPLMSVNGAAFATSGNARAGDTIRVRQTSSPSNSTEVICYIYTNGLSVDWSVTTAAFLPTNITGCQLWLDASLGVTKDGSDFVSQWDDQSGNGRDFTGSGTSKPLWVDSVLNSLPVIRFDGTNDKLLNTSTYSIQEVFIVMNNREGSQFTHLQTPFTKQTIAVADDRAFGTAGSSGTSLAEDGMAGTTGTYVDTVQTEDFSPLIDFKIANARRAAGSVSWNATTIGQDGLADARTWNGDIVEIIVYDNVISAGDRTLLIAYLQAKYGI